MKSIIFDLDLTLVDSSIAEDARRTRNWSLVYSLIPSFKIYDGLEKVFEYIKSNKIKVCIVSTAPKPYVEKVVRHFNIPCNYIVGFHDAKPIKPHPAPMIKALEFMNETAFNTISFGDRVIDIKASNAAGIESVACFWGSKEKQQLTTSRYKYAIENPCDIINYI
jgi:phosphoglycolate phosphatase-like HAD superfamily hydrolase